MRESPTQVEAMPKVMRSADCRYSLYFVTFTLGRCFSTVNKCISCVWSWIAFSFKLTYLRFRIYSRIVAYLTILGVKSNQDMKNDISTSQRAALLNLRPFFLQCDMLYYFLVVSVLHPVWRTFSYLFKIRLGGFWLIARLLL